MWSFVAGKFISVVAYFMLLKLTIDYAELNFFEISFGWFLIEYVYEDYSETSGKCFLINKDFRDLIKNLLIITCKNVVLKFYFLFLLLFSLVCVFSLKKYNFKKLSVLCFCGLFFLLFFSFKLSVNFFNKYLLLLFFILTVLSFYFIFYAHINFYFDKVKQKMHLLPYKLWFYLLIILFFNVIFVVLLTLMINTNNNFIQEFLLKILVIYIYVYYSFKK